MFSLLTVCLNYLLLFFSCSFPLFCIIQHPLAAGHCQILPTLKEFFSAFSFFLRELFREELQLPVQAASRPSKERTSTSCLLDGFSSSFIPPRHVGAVAAARHARHCCKYACGCRQIIGFVKHMAANSDSINTGCTAEEESAHMHLFVAIFLCV